MFARSAVLVGLASVVLAIVLARRTDSGSRAPPTRTFEAAGMSLTAPAGWSGRATALDSHQRAPLVEARHNRGIRVSAVELGNAPGSSRFPAVELPVALGGADLRDNGRAVKTFSTGGRSFVVEAEFPRRALPKVLDEVNDVISTLHIRRAPGADAGTRARLTRPLHLPRVTPGRCPRSPTSRPSPATSWALGRGPAFPVLGRTANLRDDIVRNGWHLHKTLWAIAPAYRGPLLVRGRRIDATGLIRFGNRLTLYMYWAGAWPGTSGWRYVPSTTAVRHPGCYAFQVDGLGFSRVVVFEAQL